MSKILKRIRGKDILFVLFITLLCVMGYMFYLRLTARSAGEKIGIGCSYVAGKATGSLQGVLESEEAFKNGKEAGLSAEDTKSKLIETMKKVSDLEVLVASVRFTDEQIIGNNDYAALYLLKGDVIFSIDLNEVEVEYCEDNGNELNILIPEPESRIIYNADRVEKVAEYQKHFFSGSAEDGYDAYMNSMTNIINENAKSIENYDTLKAIAEESAIKQVSDLANAIVFEDVHINVAVKRISGE